MPMTRNAPPPRFDSTIGELDVHTGGSYGHAGTVRASYRRIPLTLRAVSGPTISMVQAALAAIGWLRGYSPQPTSAATKLNQVARLRMRIGKDLVDELDAEHGAALGRDYRHPRAREDSVVACPVDQPCVSEFGKHRVGDGQRPE